MDRWVDRCVQIDFELRLGYHLGVLQYDTVITLTKTLKSKYIDIE